MSWDWAPSILIGLILWVAGYALVSGPLRRRGGWFAVSTGRKIAFYAGSTIVFIALVSPLDRLADEYLFSAHMLQHMLLMMVAPPLWLIGVPDGLIDRIVPRKAWGVTQFLVGPVAAFVIYNLMVWAWHVPSAYDAALESERLHLVEHLTFMAAGVIGWWPVLGRSEKAARPAALPVQIIYLFVMMFPMTLLAALITFVRVPIYPFYTDAPRLWGLSVMDDQQVAGLLMWIPGNMIFFVPIAFIFFKWMGHEDETGDIFADWDFPVAGGDEPPDDPGMRPAVRDRQRSAKLKS